MSFKNPTESPVVIALMAKDSVGSFKVVQRDYTSAPSDTFSVHGFKPVKQKFGYFVRGSFGNKSDTTYKFLKPLFSVQLNPALFTTAHLPSDFGDYPNEVYGGGRMPFHDLWDNKVGATHYFWQTTTHPLPIWCTIDLGQKARISRVIMYWRWHYNQYTGSCPKVFELWGSADPNIKEDKSDPFNSSWVELGKFVVTTPDGKIPPSSKDINTPYPFNGENFNIPNASNKPPIRYLRIVIDRTWGNVDVGEIGEIKIFGQPSNPAKNK